MSDFGFCLELPFKISDNIFQIKPLIHTLRNHRCLHGLPWALGRGLLYPLTLPDGRPADSLNTPQCNTKCILRHRSRFFSWNKKKGVLGTIYSYHVQVQLPPPTSPLHSPMFSFHISNVVSYPTTLASSST